MRTEERVNSFVEVYKKCNNGRNAEKHRELLAGNGSLKYIDLEVTNHCNLGCYMCPVGTRVMRRPRGYMSMELIEKLCEELRDSSIAGVQLIRWGEPTMHPQFLEILRKLKETGKLVHFNTNGTLMDRDMIQGVIDLKVDSVKFSFQGVDKASYEEMRYGSSWDKLMENIRLMNALRGDLEKPYIQISTTTTSETQEQIDGFKALVSGLCDYCNVGKTELCHLDVERMNISDERKEMFAQLKKRETLLKQRLPACPEVYDKLSVNWDGTVSACCADYDKLLLVGDLRSETLREIFEGVPIQRIRDVLSKENYDALPVCRNCYQCIELRK